MSEFDFSDDIDDDALIRAAVEAEDRMQSRTVSLEEPQRPAKRVKTGVLEKEPMNAIRVNQRTQIGPSEDRMYFDNIEDSELDDHGGTSYGNTLTLTDEAETDYDEEFGELPSTIPPPASLGALPNGVGYRVSAPMHGLVQTTLFGNAAPEETVSATQAARKHLNYRMAIRNEPPTHHKLNLEAAKTWVYPLNLGKVRQYQHSIVKRGLFNNTLVALPTGLGKTFIAATVMLNWYRWTKDSQIVFVAPTKPLVSQQIHACFHIVGIPYSDTVVLTGEVQKHLRAEAWKTKRVFFMTPQTLQEDLSKGSADPKRIVLLVVDEAHRAKGNYAFVRVVSFLNRFNPGFRVLALTATPGGDVESVQQVIDNLNIAHIEIRTDQSLDIREYVHDRQVEREIFKNSDEMTEIMGLYSEALKPLMTEVQKNNVLWFNDPLMLTPFGCNQAQRSFRATEAGKGDKFVMFKTSMILTCLAKLSHGMDLFKFHGMSAAFAHWVNVQAEYEAKSNLGGKWPAMVLKSNAYIKMMDKLEVWTNDENFVGHPKMEYLRDVIMNHLLDSESNPSSSISGTGTRIMVFSSFRDSAEDIAKVLKRANPLIKPHVFVGQADSKKSKGMTQKQQLQVIESFKKGEFNVLIATSIGEEGLDIGEVDLIVCYDTKASPLRMLQRMGRTGRKRAGRVVMLQMEGKEERDWEKAKDSYIHMQEQIARGTMFDFQGEKSRRILPWDVEPELDESFVEIPIENTQILPDQLPTPGAASKKAKKKIFPSTKPKLQKKFNMPDGVITGFVTAGSLAGNDASKKKPAKIQRSNSKTKVSPEAQQEIEPIPVVEQVTLKPEQEAELERKYMFMHFGDEEESLILGPALDKFPEHQRDLSATKYVKHGRASKSFVAMVGNMQDDRYDARPTRESLTIFMRDGDPGALLESDKEDQQDDQDDDLPDVGELLQKPKNPNGGRKKAAPPAKAPPKAPKAMGRGRGRPRKQASREAEEGNSSSPPATDPAYAIRSRGIWIGSEDTVPPSSRPNPALEEEEDDDLDGFIIGDDEPISDLDNSNSEVSPMVGRLKKKTASNAKLAAMFSEDDEEEEEDEDEDEDGDDLPDVFDLMKGKTSAAVFPPTRGRAKRKAHILYDSDEE